MGSVTKANARERLGRLLASVPDEHNRSVLDRYSKERLANGIKPMTVANDLNCLRDLALFLEGRKLEDVDRDRMAAFLADLQTTERTWRSRRTDGTLAETKTKVRLSEGTLSVRRSQLKAFYKWLRGTHTYPPEVAWMSTARPRKDRMAPQQLVEPDDMKRLLQSSPELRDKAALAVLYDGGLRSGELRSLNVGSVEFDQHGARLDMERGADGLKTGARRVRLFESVPYLHEWYEAHPHKDDPHEPLFIGIGKRDRGKRLSGSALSRMVKRAGERATLKKHLHPHLFRHTAATNAARAGYTEEMMREKFGWSRSSDMPTKYTHLARSDYEDMELERRGLKERDDKERSGLAPLTCRACAALNPVTAHFCSGCRAPLTPAAEGKLDTQRTTDFKESVAREVATLLKAEVADEVRRALADD